MTLKIQCLNSNNTIQEIICTLPVWMRALKVQARIPERPQKHLLLSIAYNLVAVVKCVCIGFEVVHIYMCIWNAPQFFRYY